MNLNELKSHLETKGVRVHPPTDKAPHLLVVIQIGLTRRDLKVWESPIEENVFSADIDIMARTGIDIRSSADAIATIPTLPLIQARLSELLSGSGLQIGNPSQIGSTYHGDQSQEQWGRSTYSFPITPRSEEALEK